MRRPWRIEFRIRMRTTAPYEPEGWTPWERRMGAFATREAAERMAKGEFGWYLSFAAAHEVRIVNVDDAAGPA